MKFSPHSLFVGTDLVFGALKEWKESTLLCENDLFCIVPLCWLVTSIQKALCWLRVPWQPVNSCGPLAATKSLISPFRPPSVFYPSSGHRRCYPWRPKATTTNEILRRQVFHQGRQMVSEINEEVYYVSFCVSSETRFVLFYYDTHTRNIVQVLFCLIY